MRTEPNDYKDIHQFLDEHGEELDKGIIHEEDISTIFDFLLEMGMSELRAVKSKLIILYLHMIKYQYQQQKQTASWIKSIREARDFISFAIQDSKALGNKLSDKVQILCYKNALVKASDETGINKKNFPQEIPEEYMFPNIVNHDYMENFLLQYAYSNDAKRYLFIK